MSRNVNYVGRFAPSPTGPLHCGSLVAAVASYLDARAHGGRWLVRMEDVDRTRCHAEHAEGILATLSAFGFRWDGEVQIQSERTHLYDAALAGLRARGLVYACTCSRKEIADSALTGIEGPVYPGTCRAAHHPEAGLALRVRTDKELFSFRDRLQGEIGQCIETEIGDFVVKRRDGCYAYQLAVVVDDADQGVTHVVRGADLIDSTPRQIYLQKLLGLPTPAYLHIPVVTGPAGEKLSKQNLAPEVHPLEAGSYLLAALRTLGQETDDKTVTNHHSPAELLEKAAGSWRPERIPRARTLPMHSIGAEDRR